MRRAAAALASVGMVACGSTPAAEMSPKRDESADVGAGLNSARGLNDTQSATTTTTAPEPTTTVTSSPPQRPVTTLAVVPSTEPPILPERAQDDLTDVEWAIYAAFGSDGAAAVRVARCESGLNPGAVNGAHAGLFQLSGTYHRERAARLGYSWADMFTVFGNVAVAYDLFTEQGWRPWTCKP